MSKRNNEDFLSDILEAIKRIFIYSDDVEYDDFLTDFKTQDAIVRNIEIIGEAVKNLSNDFRDQHTTIPWKNLAGMRDKLIHNYSGVNFDIVWEVIKKDLPKLVKQIEKILDCYHEEKSN